jgi:hypothetical protein
MLAAAVMLKSAVVAPAGTVTEGGTVTRALLLPSITLVPPARAAWVSVTVQIPVALWPRLVGMQVTVETNTGACRATLVICELAPRVALTVAF